MWSATAYVNNLSLESHPSLPARPPQVIFDEVASKLCAGQPGSIGNSSALPLLANLILRFLPVGADPLRHSLRGLVGRGALVLPCFGRGALVLPCSTTAAQPDPEQHRSHADHQDEACQELARRCPPRSLLIDRELAARIGCHRRGAWEPRDGCEVQLLIRPQLGCGIESFWLSHMNNSFCCYFCFLRLPFAVAFA